MKHLVALIFFGSFAIHSYSQETKASDSLFSFTTKWQLSTHLISQPYIFTTEEGFPNVFTGIGITRKIGAIGIRLNYNYFDNDKSESIYTDTGFTFDNLSYLEEHIFRIGIEYQSSYSKNFSLLFFADYILAPFRSNYTIFSEDDIPIIFAQTEGLGNGSTLGIGVNFRLNKHVSLSGETRLDFMWLEQNQKIKNYDSRNVVEYWTSENTMNLKLIGHLSLNYHF